MNILFWTLQVLLAFHTATGAFWKFSNSVQTVPSLKAIPSGIWLSLSGIEILCSLVLLLPALWKPAGKWVPTAAGFVAAEMLLFIALAALSGEANSGEIIYWGAVAIFAGFVAYGRLKITPHS